MNDVIADLHLHSIRSDGSWTEEELLAELRKRNVRIFSLTDHDTAEGVRKMEEIVPEDMKFIRGIEFSCITEAGKCHILGYGFDPEAEAFRAAVETGRVLREEKFRKRLEHLKRWHGIELSEEEMKYLRAQNSVGKPHLARILIRRGLAGTIGEAIRNYLDDHGGKDSGDARIDGDLAVSAILSSGGIPVWAHPFGGEGEKPLTEEEFARHLRVLKGLGIRGLECFYSRYSAEQEEYLLRKAREYGLLVSGGSDCHGTNKNILPGEERADGSPADPALFTVLEKL